MGEVKAIYVETPIKVEKGDFLVVDDVQECMIIVGEENM